MIVHELNKKSETTFPEGKIVTLDDRMLDSWRDSYKGICDFEADFRHS